MAVGNSKLTLPDYLFWDLDVSKLDLDYSYQLVIERVIQLGTLPQWRAAQLYYGKDRFLEVAKNSRQLSQRERDFTSLFTQSDYNAPSRQTGTPAKN
ncbi:DUF6922 domain-containing protein [Neolewinella sp.]|uniref:DUF6922 domain-containing protein n=1 Tax=Neolewinella sp. TaxID=2993543 RepID=UPI003B5280D9